MKKIILTFVFGIMTMVGFGQTIKITVDKAQDFTHSGLINTSYAAENELLNYGSGGEVDCDFIFDLDKKELKQVNRLITNFEKKFKINEIYKTSNILDVIVEGSNGEEILFVLGVQKEDNKNVLIQEKIVDGEVIGRFYPEPKIEIVKP